MPLIEALTVCTGAHWSFILTVSPGLLMADSELLDNKWMLANSKLGHDFFSIHIQWQFCLLYQTACQPKVGGEEQGHKYGPGLHMFSGSFGQESDFYSASVLRT